MKKYFPEVDGLRGFLALYIFVFHFNSHGNRFEGAFGWVNDFFASGANAVSYFFVVSGFLILNSFYRVDGTKSYTTLQFLGRRAFRIFPLLHALIIYKVIRGWPIELNVLSNMFLFFGLTPYNFVNLPVMVSWSLYVEEVFYITVPLIFRFINLRTSLFGFVIFNLTATLWNAMVSKYNFFQGLRFENPMNTFHFFFLGMLLYMAWNEKWFEKGTTTRVASGLVDILTTALIALTIFGIYVPSAEIGGLLLLTTLMPGSIYSYIWRSSYLKWAGLRCYSIYLLHSEVLWKFKPMPNLKEIFPRLDNNVLVGITFVMTTLLVFIIAEIAYRLVEVPFIKLGKWLFRNRTAIESEIPALK